MKVLLAFAACMLFVFHLRAEQPIFRAGIISDTHVTEEKSSCAMLKNAMALFKTKNVDLVINLGDIAHFYSPAAYRNYRAAVNEIFPVYKSRPKEVFAFANHDWIGRKNEPYLNVYNDVKTLLGVGHKPGDIVVFKEYIFVIVPQFYPLESYRKLMDSAVKANKENKQIFVIDHSPAFDTVYNSCHEGSYLTRDALSNYPGIIHLSGHIHGNLANEANIHQDTYTSVNAGCISSWAGRLVGNVPCVKPSDMVLIMEVFEKKVVFRRFFAETGIEYKKDTPWTVSVPFDSNDAPYNPEKRRENSVVPGFSRNSKLDVKVMKDGVTVSFPAALPGLEVETYCLELEKKNNGKWQTFARQDVYGGFETPLNPPESIVHHFAAAYFESGKEYRVNVKPKNFFGKCGKSLTAVFTMGKMVSAAIMFESRNPMQEMEFFVGLNGNKPVKLGNDGFYILDENWMNTRLVFPESVWQGAEGTRFCLTFDIHTKQGYKEGVTMALCNTVPGTRVRPRIYSPGGDSGVLRYVIVFEKAEDAQNYILQFGECDVCKLKFEYVKIERL